MTEQLYRWVKASERMPDKKWFGPSRYEGNCYESGNYLVVQGLVDDQCSDIEWLEPIPSLNAGSLEEAAKEHANYEVGECDIDEDVHDPDFVAEYKKAWNKVTAAFLAGAAYVKGGEENQDWPPNVWQLGNGAQSHLHGKWCYAYRDSEGLNQHQYPFDTEAEAIEDYRKRFFPSRPSLDIVDELREANPYETDGAVIGFHQSKSWQKCCDKLQELLNQKEGK